MCEKTGESKMENVRDLCDKINQQAQRKDVKVKEVSSMPVPVVVALIGLVGRAVSIAIRKR